MCGEVCAACRGYVQDNRKVCAMPWPRQDSKNDERGYVQVCAKGMCGYVRVCAGMCEYVRVCVAVATIAVMAIAITSWVELAD